MRNKTLKQIREEITIITSFPPKGAIHGEDLAGIASYAKNTVRSISRLVLGGKKLSLNVLAEQLNGEENYIEGNIRVKRVWKRNSLTSFPLIFKEIFKNHKNAKTILFEFDLSMFGGLIFLFPFPLFLVALKLLNKKIIFVLHQVVPNMEEVTPHVNLSHKSFNTSLLNGLLSLFYSFLLLLSSKIIVFEEDLRVRLTESAFKKQKGKIVVIPHGVEEFKRIPTKERARKKLGLPRGAFVILSFGFLAWYKGTDWLIHAIDEVKTKRRLKSRDIQLVLAGGPNPNHEDKEYYQKYIKGIIRECRKAGFTLTGFVPEKDIPLYFKACDLVVLPYRTFMSSSGPLSITFSFKKPFLLSPKLRGVLSSSDIKELLRTLNLKEEDLVFQDFEEDFERKILKLRRHPKLLSKMVKLATGLGQKRSWDVIGKKYYEELLN